MNKEIMIMKKYLSILLSGAILVGFTACEEKMDILQDKDNIAVFCNSLLDLSVEEVDRKIQAQGFEDSYTQQDTIQMGPYSTTAGWYNYSKGDISLRLEWLNGNLCRISYQTTPDSSLMLETEEALYQMTQGKEWKQEYYNLFGECSRAEMRADLATPPHPSTNPSKSIEVDAFNVDYPQSPLFNNTAYGTKYGQVMALSPVLHPSVHVYYYVFGYYVAKEFYYLPQALYMPNDTIRVGEYLHKASTQMVDDVIDETRVTYSNYNDELPIYSMAERSFGYYSCGMAFFAPAGTLDLEANKVTHTSSDESILLVEQDECQAGKEFYEKIRIKAIAPGKATLTVRWKDLSTTATIMVIE